MTTTVADVYTQWLETAPKIVGTRKIDWDHILHYIPLEQKITAAKIVMEELDLFEDGDHQVVFVQSVFRFKERFRSDYIDFNKMCTDVQLGKLPVEDYNQMLRDSGYSLSGYRDVRHTPSKNATNAAIIRGFAERHGLAVGRSFHAPFDNGFDEEDYLTDADGFYVLNFVTEDKPQMDVIMTLFGRIRDEEGLRNDCIPVEISAPFSYKILYDTLDEILEPEGKMELFVASSPLTEDSFEKHNLFNGDFIEIKLLPKE